jgi:hypothetical protein
MQPARGTCNGQKAFEPGATREAPTIRRGRKCTGRNVVPITSNGAKKIGNRPVPRIRQQISGRDHGPAPALRRPISTSSKVGSMSPFFGTNPILVKWSWLDPRILVLAVQARGRASSQPRNAASTRGLRCPHRTCYCAVASPDARWFAGKCLHSLPLATAPQPHNDRVAVANMSSSACPSAWAGTVPRNELAAGRGLDVKP